MSTPPMHSQRPADAQLACDTCGSLFTPRRGWARFCSTRCRNAFHGAEQRVEKIRQAAVPLYEALRAAREAMRGKDLEHVWLNYPNKPEETLADRIDKLLGKLKPPVEPKALLEKAKA